MDSKSDIKEGCYYINMHHKNGMALHRINAIVTSLRMFVDNIATQYYLIAKNYIQYSNIRYNSLLELYNYVEQLEDRKIDTNKLENTIVKIFQILDNVDMMLDVSMKNTYNNIKKYVVSYKKIGARSVSIEEIMDDDDYNSRISRIIREY